MDKITRAARMVGALLLAVNAGMTLAKSIREHSAQALRDTAGEPGGLDGVILDALKRAKASATRDADAKGGNA